MQYYLEEGRGGIRSESSLGVPCHFHLAALAFQGRDFSGFCRYLALSTCYGTQTSEMGFLGWLCL